MRADAFDLSFRKLRRIVRGYVPAEDVVGQQFAMLHCQIRQHGRADRAGGVTAHRRLQFVDRDLPLGDRRDPAERHDRSICG